MVPKLGRCHSATLFVRENASNPFNKDCTTLSP